MKLCAEMGHWCTWNDGKQIVPATPDTPSMPLYELLEWNAELLFDCARAIDVPTDTKQLGACSSIPSVLSLFTQK